MQTKDKSKRRRSGGAPFIHLVSPSAEGGAREVDAVGAAPPPPSDTGLRRRNSLRVWRRFGFMSLALVVGLLLGRAVILGALTPFPIAAYAASTQMRRGVSIWVSVGLVVGALTAISAGANPFMVAAMLLAYRAIVWWMKRFESVDMHVIPFLVFAVDTGFRLGFSIPVQGFTWFAVGMSTVDGVLAFILTVLFLQMPPFVGGLRPTKPLRPDEIVGVVILLASVLTGLHGLSLSGVSLEGVLARFLVVVFAAVGGAGIGGAVGIVTGVILVLGVPAYGPLIGILGFAGVLAGLLREGRRFAVAAGFFVGAALLTLYTVKTADLRPELVEAAIATLLFLATPNTVFDYFARFVPGTPQHGLTQQEHVRRVKDIMVARIREVARVFAELSSSFKDATAPVVAPDAALSQTVETTVNDVCRKCRKYNRCWEQDFYATYREVEETVAELEASPRMEVADIPSAFHTRCVKLELFLGSLKKSGAAVAKELSLLRQLDESRSLVASQLDGVSKIMGDLAMDISREAGGRRRQEDQILAVIGSLGLEVQGVDIVSLEEGKVEIEILQRSPSGHDECGKLIAPLLSEALGEALSVRDTQLAPDGSYQVVTLASSKRYQVSAGFAGAAKDGGLQSGDSYSVVDVGASRSAVALSDGMGNGIRASQESGAAVTLVQQLLRAGFDESVAIKTVNSALFFRSTEEMYATLDLAIIDLFSAEVDMLKVGSVPSYIKRGKEVSVIRGENLPIGILSDIEVQTKALHAAEGDILVFMSDGILDAVSQKSDPEGWVKSLLERFETGDPQTLADLVLEAAVRAAGGLIRDDMTVLCAKIERYKPQWATIRLPNLPSLRGSRGKKEAPVEDRARLVHV